MISSVQRVTEAREAGAVERCHGMPHHGEYSVAKHCYNAVSMLFILHPAPSMNLVQAMLWHDGAERWLGDVPSPGKWGFPKLGGEYLAAETAVLDFRGMGKALKSLTGEEFEWLNAIDILEFWVWAHEQIFMGNQNVFKQRATAAKYMEGKIAAEEFPKPCEDFFMNYMWTRLTDHPME